MTTYSEQTHIHFRTLASELAGVMRRLSARGWMPATAGNGSALVSRDPFLMAVTASGADKSLMVAQQVLMVNTALERVSAIAGCSSAEAPLHVEIMRSRAAGAVLHTHSVWATALSNYFAHNGKVFFRGYELLKALAGVRSHLDTEELPIIENDQDMQTLSMTVSDRLERFPQAHGFLLQGHGLYTWGANIGEALRHVETFEFLLETVGREFSLRER